MYACDEWKGGRGSEEFFLIFPEHFQGLPFIVGVKLLDEVIS